MKYPIVCFFGIIDTTKAKEKFTECTFHIYKNDQTITKVLQEIKPTVLVTIGESWRIFPVLPD